MADIEWEPLPTPMWPEGSVMAALHGLMLEATFDEGVPTWKVQRPKGKNAFPELVSSGTADSLEAAKAAARYVAETSNNGLPDSAGGGTPPAAHEIQIPPPYDVRNIVQFNF